MTGWDTISRPKVRIERLKPDSPCPGYATDRSPYFSKREIETCIVRLMANGESLPFDPWDSSSRKNAVPFNSFEKNRCTLGNSRVRPILAIGNRLPRADEISYSCGKESESICFPHVSWNEAGFTSPERLNVENWSSSPEIHYRRALRGELFVRAARFC